MLGQPEAAIAPLFDVLGQLDGAGDGRARRFAGAHADEIEDGNGKGHGDWMWEIWPRVQGVRGRLQVAGYGLPGQGLRLDRRGCRRE